MAELNSVEHIQAIHLLLLHANTKLWKGKDANKSIRDFVASFTQRASCLADNASILGNTFKKSEIRGWVKVNCDMSHVDMTLCLIDFLDLGDHGYDKQVAATSTN